LGHVFHSHCVAAATFLGNGRRKCPKNSRVFWSR
jgi:hypothetical protein